MIKLHIFHEDQGGGVFILQFLISGKKCQLHKISYKNSEGTAGVEVNSGGRKFVT